MRYFFHIPAFNAPLGNPCWNIAYLVKLRCSQLLHNVETHYLQQTI